MARYPSFDDYERKRNWSDGVKRCDELLKKSPKDFQLLIVKWQLLYASRDAQRANAVLDEIVGLQLQNVQQLTSLELVLVEMQQEVFPPISTAGPHMAKIWDGAIKAASTLSQKWDLASLRFDRAVLDNRLTDAQQALIQLKALQPKNRALYMAHAAFTQLISTANDDLQARLAIGLARKAVTEKFDEDPALDCRVPGQIFAAQRSEKDLESIAGKRFADSKQVWDATRKAKPDTQSNGVGTTEVPDPASVPSHVWLAAEIASLKRRFAELIESQAPTTAIQSFAISALKLFRSSITTLSSNARRSPADACFLAISALVRLYEQSSEKQFLLHAAFAAEALLRHDSHIHEARLVLVYLYMRLRLGSIAMRFFDSLSVKEVQYDTVGHVLFTRISLIHPYPMTWSKKGKLDPLRRAGQALAVYSRCETKLTDTVTSVLDHGQAGMIFDLQELRNSLRRSLQRRVTLLELRRIARLTADDALLNAEAAAMGPLVCANWTETQDTRDLDEAFNHGYSVERVLFGEQGTVPGTARILFTLAADVAWSIATENEPMIKDSATLLEQIERLKAGADAASPAASLGMTAEYLAGDVACGLLRLLLSLETETTATSVAELLDVVQATVDKLEIESLCSTSDGLAEHLLDHYADADILRLVIKASQHVSMDARVDAGRLQALQDLAKRLFAKLQQHAAEQQAASRANAVRQTMSENEEIWTALQALGVEDLDKFCEAAAKSAREGWEGVAKIKMI